jgi:hypothetical protein
MMALPLSAVVVQPAPFFVDGRPNFALPLNNSLTVALAIHRGGMVLEVVVVVVKMLLLR